RIAESAMERRRRVCRVGPRTEDAGWWKCTWCGCANVRQHDGLDHCSMCNAEALTYFTGMKTNCASDIHVGHFAYGVTDCIANGVRDCSYHRRPNGSASLIRSTPRGEEQRSVQAKISRKKGNLSYLAIIMRCATIKQKKDHVLTLGVEENFQGVAV